ncbi:hypothetical protein B5X24_HaOG213901 [Helicoverpa armigera]|nr:hypothetical protein B5X24_HaOG213901 [Helicoverpa armigera]
MMPILILAIFVCASNTKISPYFPVIPTYQFNGSCVSFNAIKGLIETQGPSPGSRVPSSDRWRQIASLKSFIFLNKETI